MSILEKEFDDLVEPAKILLRALDPAVVSETLAMLKRTSKILLDLSERITKGEIDVVIHIRKRESSDYK